MATSRVTSSIVILDSESDSCSSIDAEITKRSRVDEPRAIELDSDSSFEDDTQTVKRPRTESHHAIIIDSDSCSSVPEMKMESIESQCVVGASDDEASHVESDSSFKQTEDISRISQSSTTPVFSSGVVKLNAEELIRILLETKRHEGRICERQPLRIRETKAFVVNTDKLSTPDDLKADDLGSWKNDGQHSRWFKVGIEDGKVLRVEFCSGKPKNDSSAYCLHRHYFVHHSTQAFKRKIVYLTDYKGRRHNLTLVQYICSSQDEVQFKPHGNSQSSDPYFRSSKSTLSSLKKMVKSEQPKEAVEKLSNERGGELSSESAGSLPRNRQQAYNVKRHQKSEDPLYSLILESQNLDRDRNHYIREVRLAPEPCVVMAMDYQLVDIDSFCTSPDHHCILGIDPTFDLGQFNITVTTYKQLQLINKNGEPPTFVGPLFLHYRKTFSCYHSFASSLLGLNKNLANIRAFGTDGETSLIEAFRQQCNSATHLLCFTHCRDNVKRKLRELRVPPNVASDYLMEIFGGQQGTTYIEGLADSSSEADFDEKLSSLEHVWNLRESPFNSPPQFYTYFRKHKAFVFKESMIQPVRTKAGLGNPPKKYHNNNPECINNVIKMKVDRKKRNSLDEFCHKMKSLVQDQQNQLIRAVTRRGEYRLHSVYRDFEMSPMKWFEMDESNRDNHIRRLSEAAKNRMKELSNVTVPSLDLVPSTPSKSSNYDDSSTTDTPQSSLASSSTSASFEPLAVSPSNKSSHSELLDWSLITQVVNKTSIPESSLNGIWTKAESLLNDSSAITAAPVGGQARMVKSNSQPLQPHLVRVLSEGKIVCDENCQMWSTLKICAHCVAVAHNFGKASQFASWVSKNAKSTNLTKVTTKQVSQSVGKKPSNRHSIRKKMPTVKSRVSFTPPTSICGNSSTLPSSDAPSTSSSTFPNSYAYPMPWNHGSQAGFLPSPSDACCSYVPYSNSFYSSPTFQASPYYGYPAGYRGTTPAATPLTFWVCLLNNRITTCYGCRAKFVRAADGGIPVPPLDLILKCTESREYYDRDGNKREKENSNTYYHPNITCIRIKHPEFNPSNLAMDDSIRSILLDCHFDLLWSVFNFQ